MRLSRESINDLLYNKSNDEIKEYIEQLRESTSDNIIDAVYLSEWDDGFLLEQQCKVSLETLQIFDIEYDMETLSTLENLQGECIVIDGAKIPLVPKDEYESGNKIAFWYGEDDCLEEAEKEDEHYNKTNKKYEAER